jgi:transposase-like protein
MASKPSSQLIAGTDYPRNLVDFGRFFPNEAACLQYLENLRWRDGFLCPGCGESNSKIWRSSRDLVVCSHCRKHVSVTSDTIFHGTRTQLTKWFMAAWEITSQKYGANALGLQRVLGLGSYHTAWAWLHKFRRAMVRPDRDHLSGTIEVDESYVGGEEAGVAGRQSLKKAIVAIAVEVRGSRMGRIRLRRVLDVSGDSLETFVSDVVIPGSTIQTDGWSGYNGLNNLGFNHVPTVLSSSPDPAHVLMPAVHRVASLLKRWLLGTLQGAVAKEQLAYYLDEFTFRFNRRNSRSRGLLFYRLLEQSVAAAHTPTKALYMGTGRGRRRAKTVIRPG